MFFVLQHRGSVFLGADCEWGWAPRILIRRYSWGHSLTCPGESGSRLGWQRRRAETPAQERLGGPLAGRFEAGQLRLLPAGVEGLWPSPPPLWWPVTACGMPLEEDVVRVRSLLWPKADNSKITQLPAPLSEGGVWSFLPEGGAGQLVTEPTTQKIHLRARRKSSGTTKGNATFNHVKIRSYLPLNHPKFSGKFFPIMKPNLSWGRLKCVSM